MGKSITSLVEIVAYTALFFLLKFMAEVVDLFYEPATPFVVAAAIVAAAMGIYASVRFILTRIF